MPSDQPPDRLRLVAEPDQRLDSNTRRDEPREEPRLSRAEPQIAGSPGAAPRIHRIGTFDPMAELDDFDEEAETNTDPDDDDGQERNVAPRSRWLPIATAVFALLGFAGIVWYAYQWGASNVTPEELPVIRAQEAPIKIKPKSPGGLEVPYQETLALNQMEPDPEKPQVERLLPPPETPMVPSTPAAPAAAAPETPAPENPVEVAPIPVPATPSVAAATPTVQVAPKAASTQTAAASSGGFVIQLASLAAKDRASAESARLQKRFPTLLGDRQMVVVPVDLGSRGTFYRVQAGYFPDRASAEVACAQLKAKRQDCLVTKR